MGAGVELCQSYVNAQQRARLSPAARPYPVGDNIGNDTREYGLFKRRFAEPRAGLAAWGVVSWRFRLKSGVDPTAFLAFAEAQVADGADCVFLNPYIGLEAFFVNVWEQWLMDSQGKMFDLIQHVTRRTGGDMQQGMTADQTAYCNYFVATEGFWNRYFAFVDDIIADCEAEAARGSAVGAAYRAQSGYQRGAEVTNKVFLIERLFPYFMQRHPDLRCVAMPADDRRFAAKFGIALGSRMRQLSELKQRGCLGDAAATTEWHQQRQALAQQLLGVVVTLEDPPESWLPAAAA